MRNHPSISGPRNPLEGLERLGITGAISQSVASLFADPVPPQHMTVGESRLPMHADAEAHQTLDCNTCHGPHSVDTAQAAVQACATCHDDSHTRAYFGSPHHTLLLAEQSGNAPTGSGVSCATCHMPGIETRDTITTNHNQNDTLRPNEKMIKSVCLDCHGLEYSLNSLADRSLIERNFVGNPNTQIKSVEWALQRL